MNPPASTRQSSIGASLIAVEEGLDAFPSSEEHVEKVALQTLPGEFSEDALRFSTDKGAPSRGDGGESLLNRSIWAQKLSAVGTSVEDVEEQCVKGGGKGGQKINKTNNCVVIVHSRHGLVIRCQQSRSQRKNRIFARELLLQRLEEIHLRERQRIRDAAERERRRERRPTEAQKARVRAEKQRRSERKEERRRISAFEE
ncbi:peptidyl-tRNA hydrolase domain-containing protein [Besnoitia besnoiti]|uniref:Peptidyl-tRNA hydrolase domain-containing protein n=1 Tax=Besnoitia besnoiti TaxID=94643 RepID=A0A2A9MJ41_BESBE|nr:peptidyl-tRNA hydrolase domain-containing protein [Besnoitia besnoiti]PFH35986.1 peptidyl-tRNA hydrolase domain-containing protein [Besnoitia besnoiti]